MHNNTEPNLLKRNFQQLGQTLSLVLAVANVALSPSPQEQMRRELQSFSGLP